MLRILFIVTCLSIAFLIPLFYYDLIKIFVINLHSGWVFTSFFLRFLVIIFFVIALNLSFSFFRKTREIKFVYVFLIGLLPGFGISFITPIYNTDYGDYSDDMVLDDIKVLQDSTYNAYKPKEEKHLIAFFNTGCGHCQDVAAKLGINKNAGQKIDVNCFFVEEEPAIEEFLKNCYGESFKIYQLKDPELFIRLSGFELPSIYLIDRNSSTLKHWTGNVINFSTLDYLLGLDP